MLLFDELVFPDRPLREVNCGGTTVSLRRFQTIVWVTLCPPAMDLPDKERDALPAHAPILPALLDTGTSSTFLIPEAHLPIRGQSETQWRFNLDAPRSLTDASGRTNLLPRLFADLWLRAENPRQTEITNYRIRLGNLGVDLYTKDLPTVGRHVSQLEWNKFVAKQQTIDPAFRPRPVLGPRLPVLGMNALSAGNLKVEVVCTLREVKVLLWIPRRPMRVDPSGNP